jgi:argininosuccinate lyase
MPATDPKWRAACGEVGELVLLYTALDHQLNHVIIEVLNLAKSTMLETVVATLDPRQKVEMLKERAKHIRQLEWRKATQTHAGKATIAIVIAAISIIATTVGIVIPYFLKP